MHALFRGALLGIVLLGVSQTPIRAQDGESGGESRPEWAEDGQNHLAVFVGYTDAGGGDTGPSLGLDYGYRFTRLVGIGATIEYTGADARAGVAVVSLHLHAWKELMVFIAPGVEIDPVEDSDAFLVRLGVEYGFEIGGGWEAAPVVNFDFTHRDDVAIVVGAGFGRSF